MQVKTSTVRQRENSNGFTIVELLVVVVVIAILAAITVIAYNGVTQSARKVSLDSFLSTATKKVEQYVIENGVQPSSLSIAGAKPGSGMTGLVRYSPSGYCIQASSGEQTRNYFSGRAVMSDGSCGSIGVVSTLAGSLQGFQDGPISSALFNSPSGVTIAVNGDIYVADTGNHRIRKVSNGAVSTVAGNGVSGSVDGAIGVARVSSPRNPVVAQDGTVYFLESGRLRKLTPTGVVQTVALIGTGVISQIAYDGSGGVYLFDTTLQHVSATGIVTPVATQAGYFYSENVVASDGAGGYLVDAEDGGDGWSGVLKVGSSGAERIFENGSVASGAAVIGSVLYVVAATGSEREIKAGTTVLAGSTQGFADGTGTSARFSGYGPGTLAAGQGALYFADSGNHRIRIVR